MVSYRNPGQKMVEVNDDGAQVVKSNSIPQC